MKKIIDLTIRITETRVALQSPLDADDRAVLLSRLDRLADELKDAVSSERARK